MRSRIYWDAQFRYALDDVAKINYKPTVAVSVKGARLRVETGWAAVFVVDVGGEVRGTALGNGIGVDGGSVEVEQVQLGGYN